MENNVEVYELLMKSWEYCNGKNIPQSIENPLQRLTEGELKTRQEKKRVNPTVR